MSGATIKQGDYAYTSHSVMISGDIVEVFLGKWEDRDEDTRVLRKLPEDSEDPDGELMCVLRLRRPMTIEEYRETHHPRFRPMVRSLDSKVKLVLVPTEMTCTIPDGM